MSVTAGYFRTQKKEVLTHLKSQGITGVRLVKSGGYWWFEIAGKSDVLTHAERIESLTLAEWEKRAKDALST